MASLPKGPEAGSPSEPTATNTQAAEDRLTFLTHAADQDDLERAVADQAEHLLREKALDQDTKRLERTEVRKGRLEARLRTIARKLEQPGSSREKNPLREEQKDLQAQVRMLDGELEGIKARMADRERGIESEDEVEEGGRLKGETKRDWLIRTGKITPFSRVGAQTTVSANLGEVMIAAEEEEGQVGDDDEGGEGAGPVDHRFLMKPGAFDEDAGTESGRSSVAVRRKRARLGDEDEYSLSASVSVQSSDESSGDDMTVPNHQGKKRRILTGDSESQNLADLDDGNERLYQARVRRWSDKRRDARQRQTRAERDEEKPEWQQPHPSREDGVLGENGEFRIPGDVYPSLFDYQKTGVKWLWELYTQKVGGIIGDEMGLGKTIQIIAFLAGLHYSQKLTGPAIIVCPATVMKQWVNEFHRWWAPLRVSILHTSGSGMLNIGREAAREDELEEEEMGSYSISSTRNQSAARKIVNRVVNQGHVLVTTYSGLQTYSDLLLDVEWQYAVLDEGHKIRNPNTAITLHCKELRTHNRIILSGTPMQNNLTELWSLFDFCCPLRLGTLVLFRQRFEFPIKVGGYANATNLQVETAMKCAETLKDAIGPYLLQRFKVDVAADLPKKSERVLFCKLTDLQRARYQRFLSGEEMNSILAGKRQPLFGVDILRKLCNHPDLVEHRTLSKKPGYDYGDENKSGKMQVVKALLELWQQGGHKTLLFAQHRIMLDILEKFIRNMEGFRYLRMDGNTSIKDRQDLVDKFNRDPSIHVFLLTTKVGGLGVNLTGADRVIIYDPDWNPSTDIQARERAWRLGQKKEVEIYRLMTAGTIEEKIYHRQIFKQFLTNKILRDPKQRQTFHLSDLHDLFTLGDETATTETGTLFKGTEVKFNKDKDKDKGKRSTQRASARGSREVVPASAPVVREENFADEDMDDDANANGDGLGSGETHKPERLLSAIFSRGGVHSALEHDAILNSNTDPNGAGARGRGGADPEVISREARKVADRAARELREAAELARTMPAGVPTWTGTFGVGGFEQELARTASPGLRVAGASIGGVGGGNRSGAASLLANAAQTQRQRNAAQGLNSSSLPSLSTVPLGDAASSSSPVNRHNPRGKDFMILIRDFLRAHGGSCYTQNLIDHFNRFCGTPQRTAEFKEMLMRIAVLEKGGGAGGRGGGGGGGRGTARGKWFLKKEFGGSR